MQRSGKVAFTGLSALALAALAACSGGESADSSGTGAGATAENATAAEAPIAYASLTGDAAKGEKIFLQCKTCHALAKDLNRVGPSLHGIIGRPAGKVAGFNYSEANKTSSKTWDEETMFAYLENPQRAMPGTKMAFAGLKRPQDRADLIAYLKTGPE